MGMVWACVLLEVRRCCCMCDDCLYMSGYEIVFVFCWWVFGILLMVLYVVWGRVMFSLGFDVFYLFLRFYWYIYVCCFVRCVESAWHSWFVLYVLVCWIVLYFGFLVISYLIWLFWCVGSESYVCLSVVLIVWCVNSFGELLGGYRSVRDGGDCVLFWWSVGRFIGDCLMGWFSMFELLCYVVYFSCLRFSIWSLVCVEGCWFVV